MLKYLKYFLRNEPKGSSFYLLRKKIEPLTGVLMPVART